MAVRQWVLWTMLVTSFSTFASAANYAFLVGVQKYDPTQLNPLKYTEGDVHRLAVTLVRNGYDRDNVVLMTQRASAIDFRWAPIAGKIRRELDTLLSELTKEDTIIVGFSGHGVQFKGESDSFFCPLDCDLQDRDTLVSIKNIHQALERSQASGKLLLVDACRNDPLSQLGKAARRLDIEPVTDREPPVLQGATVAIYSCSATQQSFEHPSLQGSVFFHFVNLGLGGQADMDRNREVDQLELFSFVARQVQKWTRVNLGQKQTPERRGNENKIVALVKLQANVRRPQQPQMPAPIPETKRTVALPRPQQPINIDAVANSIGMKFVVIEAGEFQMGADESDSDANRLERPKHKVSLRSSLVVSVNEVTATEFQRVMRPLQPPNGKSSPAVKVTWLDAIEFCNRLSRREGLRPYYEIVNSSARILGGNGYRLPTEAEWEFAARGRTETRWSFGDDFSLARHYAWVSDNSEGKLQPVGQLGSNPNGLNDVHGNAWEWCWDNYGRYPAEPQVDPVRNTTSNLRVIRGGSFRETARATRSSSRMGLSPSIKREDVGFRVVRTITP